MRSMKGVGGWVGVGVGGWGVGWGGGGGGWVGVGGGGGGGGVGGWPVSRDFKQVQLGRRACMPTIHRCV